MVVRHDHAELTDRVFHALADATRRDIVARTLAGGHSVSELARAYTMSFAAVQKHVTVLHDAGLVTKERRGREQVVTAHMDSIAGAAAMLEQWQEIWRGRISRMDALLADHSVDPGLTPTHAPLDLNKPEKESTCHSSK